MGLLKSLLSSVQEGIFGALILYVHSRVGGVRRDNLVSSAGLVPVMGLAEQTGLSRLIGERWTYLNAGEVRAANPAEADLDHRRESCAAQTASTMRRAACRRHTTGVQRGVCALDAGDLFARVHLRPRQPARRGGPRASGGAGGPGAAVARSRRARLPRHRLPAAPGLRPPQTGRLVRHAKIAGRALLRLGLSPQITTISTAQAAPVIAEARLRADGPPPGAPPRPRSSRPSAPPAPAGNRHDPGARRLGVWHQEGDHHLRGRRRRVLLVGEPQQRISAAIEAIDETAYTPVHYPGAVEDPDTGRGSPTPRSPKPPTPCGWAPAAR